MKGKILLLVVALAMMLPGLTAVNATAAELIYKKEPVLIRDTRVEVVRTTDNFIILYDSSSSMAGPYKGTGMTKIEALNKILKDKVEKMPELSWKAGLYSFKVAAGANPKKRLLASDVLRLGLRNIAQASSAEVGGGPLGRSHRAGTVDSSNSACWNLASSSRYTITNAVQRTERAYLNTS